MSLFKDIVKLWNSDDLLSQAWDESYEMMMLSNEIFTKAIKYLRENEDIDTIKALKSVMLKSIIFKKMFEEKLSRIMLFLKMLKTYQMGWFY